MSTSVTALLDETEDFKEEGSEMPEEEEQYPEDSIHGQYISLYFRLLAVCEKIFLNNHCYASKNRLKKEPLYFL